MRFIHILILFTVATGSAYSQNSKNVQKQHSVKGRLIALSYAYEHPISERIILNSEIINLGSFSYSYTASYGENSSWYIAPALKLEPRFHYNYFKKQEKGKSVVNNSSSFIAISLFYQPPISIGYNDEPTYYLSIIPKWGFRIPINNHFIFELSGGIGAALQLEKNSWNETYGIDASFGYIF